MSFRRIGLPGVFLALAGATALAQVNLWQDRLRSQLPFMGQRNWIVIADMAYPYQVARGIETISVEPDPLKVVQFVVDEVGRTKHLRPVVYTDAELKFVAETNAPGISRFRAALDQALQGRERRSLPHDELIKQLNEAGQNFKVLIIKTHQALPYSSVFIQLDCAYWNEKAEKQLRHDMSAASKEN